MPKQFYDDYSKEILGRQGMFDKADIESGKVKLDPNYGLWEAKKGYESAATDADRTYYSNMGKYFREHGATLDPDNKMNAKQFSDAYWGQFGAGGGSGGSAGGSGGGSRSADNPFAQGDYFSRANGYISDYLGTMNNYMKQYNEAGLAMLRDYQTNYAQALNQLRQLMETKPEVPESVKQSISLLRDQTAENAKLIDEQLNHMGVLYSGQTGKRHEDLYKNLDQQTASMLNNWLDQEHQKMYQTALKLADMQASYANNYANLASQIKLGALDKAMGLAGQEYQMRSGLAKDQFDYQNAQAAAAAEAQQAADKLYWDNYWNQMRYTTPTAGEQLTYDAAIRRLQQAGGSTGGTADTADTWAKNHATAVKMAADNIKPSQFTDRLGATDWQAYYNAINDAISNYEAQLNAGRPVNQAVQLTESVFTEGEKYIKAARAGGRTDAEIAAALLAGGYDPSNWGLRTSYTTSQQPAEESASAPWWKTYLTNTLDAIRGRLGQ